MIKTFKKIRLIIGSKRDVMFYNTVKCYQFELKVTL